MEDERLVLQRFGEIYSLLGLKACFLIFVQIVLLFIQENYDEHTAKWGWYLTPTYVLLVVALAWGVRWILLNLRRRRRVASDGGGSSGGGGAAGFMGPNLRPGIGCNLVWLLTVTVLLIASGVLASQLANPSDSKHTTILVLVVAVPGVWSLYLFMVWKDAHARIRGTSVAPKPSSPSPTVSIEDPDPED